MLQRPPWHIGHLLFAVVACATGCASDPQPRVDAATPDGGRESPDSAVVESDAETPTTTLTFRLSFRTDAAPESIFVQESTESGGPAWLTVQTPDGRTLHIVDDCAICGCDECGSCPVCGAAQPVVVEIPAPTSHDFVWDAVTHPREACGAGQSCERVAPLPPGHYVAVMCYSTTSDGVGPDHHVGETTCDSVEFDYPDADGLVERSVCFCG